MPWKIAAHGLYESCGEKKCMFVKSHEILLLLHPLYGISSTHAVSCGSKRRQIYVNHEGIY
jgi:hypothetical protein